MTGTVKFWMTVGIGLVSLTIAWADIKNTESVQATQIAAHDARIKSIEAIQALSQTDLALIKNNVDWIRQSLEHNDLERRTLKLNPDPIIK